MAARREGNSRVSRLDLGRANPSGEKRSGGGS